MTSSFKVTPIGVNAPTISLFGKSLVDWTGGVDYLRLCMTSLAASSAKPNLNLILPQPNWTRRIRRTLGPFVRSAMQVSRQRTFRFVKPHHASIADVRDAMQPSLFGVQVVSCSDNRQDLIRTLEVQNSDALFPALHTLGRDFPFPWVGYIADFQHRHLPHFFTAKERANRDRYFDSLVSDSSALCLNSHAVAADVKRFYPSSTCKTFALPFAPMPAASWLEQHQPDVLDRYQLPRRFFLVSNQFWIHKDHGTAFHALHELHSESQFRDVELVCTGTTEDHRWPNYFSELKTKIDKLGISTRVRILGRIPKVDQIEIMKQAIAVVQPTLFEGGPGGGSVYDAVSIGTRAIASNIPVNLEINHPSVRFFQAGDSADLKRAFVDSIQTSYVRPSIAQLKAQAEESKRAFGAGILASIDYVISQHQRSYSNRLNATRTASAAKSCQEVA